MLLDLGSAALSLELALEDLSDGDRQRVRVTEAPLVEGAILAAVQASVGATIDEVVGRGGVRRDAGQATEGVTMSEVRLVVIDPSGLHARPAARFVQAASRFSSRIVIRQDGRRRMRRASSPCSA